MGLPKPKQSLTNLERVALAYALEGRSAVAGLALQRDTHGGARIRAFDTRRGWGTAAMSQPPATVCLTFDFDAICVWIGPRGANSPSAISRGEFAVLGVERILKVLAERDITATFFIPGHTVETYPASVEAILAAGHEVGHHGYLHENPCGAAVEGRRAAGARTRFRGLRRRSSAVRADSDTAHLPGTTARTRSSSCSNTASATKARSWRTTSGRTGAGSATSPTPTARISSASRSIWSRCRSAGCWTTSRTSSSSARAIVALPGLSAGSKVEEIWRDEFAFMEREEPGGIFTLTMHPEIIGRGHRILMLERLIDSHERVTIGVEFTSLGDRRPSDFARTSREYDDREPGAVSNQLDTSNLNAIIREAPNREAPWFAHESVVGQIHRRSSVDGRYNRTDAYDYARSRGPAQELPRRAGHAGARAARLRGAGRLLRSAIRHDDRREPPKMATRSSRPKASASRRQLQRDVPRAAPRSTTSTR